ncbi:hypothetical protein B0H19DRAFT_1074623 [Mycena capillaripes]|nr:hypothetical protein B0H19DRAFT_1074623 [Mycena capillaripes]
MQTVQLKLVARSLESQTEVLLKSLSSPRTQVPVQLEFRNLACIGKKLTSGKDKKHWGPMGSHRWHKLGTRVAYQNAAGTSLTSVDNATKLELAQGDMNKVRNFILYNATDKHDANTMPPADKQDDRGEKERGKMDNSNAGLAYTDFSTARAVYDGT